MKRIYLGILEMPGKHLIVVKSGFIVVQTSQIRATWQSSPVGDIFESEQSIFCKSKWFTHRPISGTEWLESGVQSPKEKRGLDVGFGMQPHLSFADIVSGGPVVGKLKPKTSIWLFESCPIPLFGPYNGITHSKKDVALRPLNCFSRSTYVCIPWTNLNSASY